MGSCGSRSVDLSYNDQKTLNRLKEIHGKMSTIELLREENLMHKYYSTKSLDTLTSLIWKVLREEIENRLR